MEGEFMEKEKEKRNKFLDKKRPGRGRGFLPG